MQQDATGRNNKKTARRRSSYKLFENHKLGRAIFGRSTLLLHGPAASKT
jgi:hypothetical protein